MRHVRWLVASAAVVSLWACGSHRLAIPEPNPAQVAKQSFRQQVNHKIDLLFMIDDSHSMASLQKKMSDQLGTFMDILVDPTTKELPDMHVAVVSSSVGAGVWDVNMCKTGWPGNDGGKFLQGPGGPGHGTCTMLNDGARFLSTGDGDKTGPNFQGDIREAFKCMALLGDSGCGYEAQFKAVTYALEYAVDPNNTDNGGFLRQDAVLAIVMLTNEDDCSVEDGARVFYPGFSSKKDPNGLGAGWSYRCNEFGHLCNGQPPPHGYPDDIPPEGITLDNCVSAENMSPKNDDGIDFPGGAGADATHGHLWPTVEDFAKFVKSLKEENSDDILVAAIAGPPTPYKVVLGDGPGNDEQDPMISPSCIQPGQDGGEPETADPAVRINQWVDKFGANGLFFPICADTLKTAMKDIASKIQQKVAPSCLPTDLLWNDPANHDKGHKCLVQRGTADTKGNLVAGLPDLDECLPIVTNANAPEAPRNTPCFQLLPNATGCKDETKQTLLRICDNADCKPMHTSDERVDAAIQCALP